MHHHLDPPLRKTRKRKNWTLCEYIVVARDAYARVQKELHRDSHDPVPIEIEGDHLSEFYGDENLKLLRAEVKEKAGYHSYAIYIVPGLQYVP